jgi:hypothetical protein
MAALLVGMGALLLAVIVSALLDPSPARKERGRRRPLFHGRVRARGLTVTPSAAVSPQRW